MANIGLVYRKEADKLQQLPRLRMEQLGIRGSLLAQARILLRDAIDSGNRGIDFSDPCRLLSRAERTQDSSLLQEGGMQ